MSRFLVATSLGLWVAVAAAVALVDGPAAREPARVPIVRANLPDGNTTARLALKLAFGERGGPNEVF